MAAVTRVSTAGLTESGLEGLAEWVASLFAAVRGGGEASVGEAKLKVMSATETDGAPTASEAAGRGPGEVGAAPAAGTAAVGTSR